MKKVLLIILAALLAVAVLFFIPFQAHSQVASITLDWVAPGDDGNVGTATSYDMRWSTTRPDTTSAASKTSWWNAATQVAGMPAPLVSGSAQSKVVSPAGGFTTGNTYYFVIVATDDSGNVSGWSNVAWRFIPDATPPAPIVDLRVR